jgi:dCMP deaminase
MTTAKIFEDRSTCSRNHVGVVIARDGRIISTGYNGAPAGMPHCEHVLPTYETDAEILVSHISPVPPLPVAGMDRGCKLAIHAEANAIAYSARHGVSLEDATLYTTLSPCYACAQLIISAGLQRVVFDRSYRDPAGTDLLMAAGLDVQSARNFKL